MDTERGAYRRMNNPGGGEFYLTEDDAGGSRLQTPRSSGGQSPSVASGPARHKYYYTTASGGTAMAGQPMGATQSPPPFFGYARFHYSDILLGLIAALVAVLVIVTLLAVFVISSQHGTVTHLVSRLETFENLARNVGDASQVLRRALGERGLDSPDAGNGGDQDAWHHSTKNPDDSGASGGGWTDWLKDRGPDQEALITANAARAIVEGVRAAVRIMKQAEQSRLVEVVARTADHADQVISGPEAAHLMQAVDAAVTHPQAQAVVGQTLDMVAHLEDAVLPVVDALASELREKLRELMTSGDQALSAERFRAMARELMDVTHKLGTGMRDLVVWYRSGGPSDATMLLTDLIGTSRELLESPAAGSLVKVLEGIDWKTTGDRLSEAAHNGAAILRTVNQANTVDAGDRLIRALAGVLEDPGTKRVMALLPGVVANATALLAKPSSQRLVQQGSALMGRVDSVLGEAEAARTVERAAEFMGTLRLLLGSLVDGGLHVELGQPDPVTGQYAVDHPYLDDRQNAQQRPQGTGSKSQASLLAGLPHITGAEPEKTRAGARSPRKPRNRQRKRP